VVVLRWVVAVETLGVGAGRRVTPPGSVLLTGVWTTGTARKIVTIGMRAARGVTSHGFALNVDGDLAPWGYAVACGMPEVDMTSLARELPRPPGFDEVRRADAEAFAAPAGAPNTSFT
jgi:lipoyl(octanoyl) transferase